MPTTLVSARDMGNDRLHVEGTVGDSPDLVEAWGWMSALSNYYDPGAYDAQTGSLKPTAKPRTMTKGEKLDYCKRLLEEQNPQPPQGTPLPTLLSF